MVGATREVALLVVAMAAVFATGAAQGAEVLNAAGACRGGVPNGAYELRGKDGRLRAVGAFAMGRKTGTFIFWTEGGARSAVIPYDNDARTGTVAMWYTGARRELSRKFEAPYDNDVLHGVLRSYHPNGVPRTECRFDHGQLVSAVAWDANGFRAARGCRRGRSRRATSSPKPACWHSSTPRSVPICHGASDDRGQKPAS